MIAIIKQVIRLAVLMLCAGFLASCGKDSGTLPDGSLRYKINGEEITIHNADNGQIALFVKQAAGVALPVANYQLQSQQSPDNSFACSILTDSLHVQSYRYDSATTKQHGGTVGLYHKGQSSAILYGSDMIDITITSYHDGFISGRFTASLTPYLINDTPLDDPSLRGTSKITEGEFKNVQCRY